MNPGSFDEEAKPGGLSTKARPTVPGTEGEDATHLSVNEIAKQYSKHGTTLYKIGSENKLRDAYVPSYLPHRQKQIEHIFSILKPSFRGGVPPHLVIYGSSGTGKTAVAKQIVATLPEHAHPGVHVHGIGVNCLRTRTEYELMRSIANSILSLEKIPTKQFGAKLGMNLLYESFKQRLDERGGLYIIVLDEVQNLVRTSGDKLLYNLIDLETELQNAKVALVLITNDNTVLDSLTRSVSSRLNEHKVLFPPYQQSQLHDILIARVEEVFVKGAVDEGAVARCAVYAAQEHGDARRALALLRAAADQADREGAPKITENHVVLARSVLEQDMIIESVRSLPLQQKLSLYVIAHIAENHKRNPQSGEAYDAYRALAQRMGIEPMHPRSIRNYITNFESLCFLKAAKISRGRGRGVVHEYALTSSPRAIMLAIEEDSLFEDLKRQREQREAQARSQW